MKKPTIQSFLLAWYKKNARDLPWRRTRDPYLIWVSEIMLQQTQVTTVIPYYEKWAKRFPSVHSLATAPLDDVLEHWAGLGYYRRARMLHKGAGEVVANFGGKLPKTPEELQKIPGIGRYTAGAIASIAFETKAPILDGNVIRILTRIHGIKMDISETKTIKHLWTLAEEILPEKSLGDFNQSMMELGATVCTPDSPNCGECPVSKFCVAYQKGKPTAFPVKLKKEVFQSLKTAALIVKENQKYLVHKQPQEGRWGGLYMFPHWPDKKEMLEHLQVKKKMAWKNDCAKPALTVKHGFTKYKIELEVFKVEEHKPSSFGSGFQNSKWVGLQDLQKLAFPAPHKKIVKHLIESYDKKS